MTIVQDHKQNFETLRRAFAQDSVALLECLLKSTGERVAVLTAMSIPRGKGSKAAREAGELDMVPFAMFFNGNPYEMLNPPDPDDPTKFLGDEVPIPDPQAVLSAAIRMMVGITKRNHPTCEWYEGIEHHGADELCNALLGTTEDPTKLKTAYPGGVCPDCKEPIPDDATFGQACANCGHVWNESVRVDDEPTSSIQALCWHTGTTEDVWDEIDGPDSGHGVDHWYRNKHTAEEYYVNDDQGHYTVSKNG